MAITYMFGITMTHCDFVRTLEYKCVIHCDFVSVYYIMKDKYCLSIEKIKYYTA
jgi:hypothetical protein